MISISKVRHLTLANPPAPGRPLHLSAASGLSQVGNFFYVVADDEHHLGVFNAFDDAPGHLIRLLPGELPASKAQRKAMKPDFEALTHLPATADFPFGALLTVGSGSKPTRHTGLLLGLDQHGAVTQTRRVIDLSTLYSVLRLSFNDLNIEGAVVHGNRLTLLQRGNALHPQNACIDLSLSTFQGIADGTHSPDAEIDATIRHCALGSIDNVPLCFSDAAALPNGDLVFTAIAEDTADSYNDGPCVGAAIGVLKANGTLHRIEHLEVAHKIEGIDAHVQGDTVHLTLVTDADDASIPASLLTAQLHGYPFD